MNDTEVKELVELLLPYIKKEIKNDNDFKTNVKRKNSTNSFTSVSFIYIYLHDRKIL